jgi:hypothetical protein
MRIFFLGYIMIHNLCKPFSPAGLSAKTWFGDYEWCVLLRPWSMMGLDLQSKKEELRNTEETRKANQRNLKYIQLLHLHLTVPCPCLPYLRRGRGLRGRGTNSGLISSMGKRVIV